MPSSAAGVSGRIDILLSTGMKEPKVPLPNLVGKSVSEAKASLIAWGLRLGRVLSKKDAAIPNLQVLATTPSPYERLKEGTVVDLLISSGSNQGSASWKDIRLFEVSDGVAAEYNNANIGKALDETSPPKILIANDPSPTSPQITIQNSPHQTPPIRTTGGVSMKKISFVMPDGFMPKEVKFFHITAEGRKQIYANMHRPLELIRVEVPRIPNSKVQIYINDVPIEEQPVD